jgi:hypothetical protein
VDAAAALSGPGPGGPHRPRFATGDGRLLHLGQVAEAVADELAEAGAPLPAPLVLSVLSLTRAALRAPGAPSDAAGLAGSVSAALRAHRALLPPAAVAQVLRAWAAVVLELGLTDLHPADPG